MPIDIDFINFDDIKNGQLDQYKVVINAGSAYTSWSGAENWIDETVVTKIRQWVDQGGGLLVLVNQLPISTRTILPTK